MNSLPDPLTQTERDAELNPGLRVIPREFLTHQCSWVTMVLAFLPWPWGPSRATRVFLGTLQTGPASRTG